MLRRSDGTARRIMLPIGASAERALDEFALVLAGLVVGVDQGRLEIPVAHPLLERPQRHPGAGHPGPKGVAEIMEAQLTDLRSPGGSLEPLQQSGAVERVAGLRVTEDEVVVGGVSARLEVPIELAGNSIGQRH